MFAQRDKHCITLTSGGWVFSHKSSPRHSSVTAIGNRASTQPRSGTHRAKPWSRWTKRLFLSPCSVSSLFQPYPHFSGPGTCLLSCISGSPCRCPLYLVAISPTCFTWPEISVFPTEPLPEVGQTVSPSTSPSRLLPRWSLPCVPMHTRSPPHYWPLQQPRRSIVLETASPPYASLGLLLYCSLKFHEDGPNPAWLTSPRPASSRGPCALDHQLIILEKLLYAWHCASPWVYTGAPVKICWWTESCNPNLNASKFLIIFLKLRSNSQISSISKRHHDALSQSLS